MMRNMTKPATTRRTPAQIAADKLADTQAQLDKIEARLDRLDADIRATRIKQATLKALRDYRAQHPLLDPGVPDLDPGVPNEY